MRVRTLIAVLLGGFLAVGLAPTAEAQETTGTIAGRVTDSQGLAIPNASITVTGPQGTKSVTADTEGRYQVPFVVPGSYTVRAELSGFKAAERESVPVSLGQTASVNLVLEVGGVNETVRVTAAAPVVDTSSTTTGSVISSDLLTRIPVGRDVSETLYLAPGVSSSASAGRGNPSISGGSGLDNQYVIDGVNVTNQGYGALGSYSIVFGSLGNATPFDFIQEVQVKTGGYEAEFGQSIGGVVNVLTKSGTNQLRGSLFGNWRPSGLEGDWKQFQSENGTVQTLETRVSDMGVEGGGPLVKDHLFFFGAVDPGTQVRVLQAPDGFPLFRDGGYERERRAVPYSAKATWRSGPHNVDVSFFGDPSTGKLGPQRTSSLLVDSTTSFSKLEYGGHNQTVRYSGAFSSNWLVEASYARALNRINEVPDVNQWRVTDKTVTPNVITGGIGFYESGNRSLNDQYSIKSTHLIGEHSLKYGIEYDIVSYDQTSQRTGPTFTAPNGQQTATGAQVDILPDLNFGHIYRVTRANFNAGRETDQHYTTFFVQDNWRVGSRLTISPGIRYEQEKLAGTIIKDFSLKNNWAPRLGVTFDPMGNGQAKIFGNWGRFYARIPNDLAARALSGDDGFSRGDYFDANLTQPIPDGVETINPTTGASVTQHFLRQGVGADEIDPDAKLSYIDEFVLGGEREILPNTSFGIRYIHRSIGRALEDVANCPVAAYDLFPDACDTVSYILTNPSSSTPINAALREATDMFDNVKFNDPTHRYNAVELTLTRRYMNNWSLMSSYRWSRLRGNFEGFYREDNGQSDPGITALYDFPTNDPTYTTLGAPLGYEGDIRNLGADGILPLDRPHSVKITGSYSFPKGLDLGLNFFAQSGRPLTALASNPNYQNQGEIPLAPRGSGFETIDGFKKRTPVESQIDFHAAYSIPVGERRRVTVSADVFNLFDQKTVLEYNNFADLGFGAGPNPDFGTPTSGNVAGPQYQAPRYIRFGARLEF